MSLFIVHFLHHNFADCLHCYTTHCVKGNIPKKHYLGTLNLEQMKIIWLLSNEAFGTVSLNIPINSMMRLINATGMLLI